MSKRNGDFDDDEGFFESLLNRKNSVPMPESMVKIVKAGAALGVLFVVGLITWAVWPSGGNDGNGAVPIIRAETGDYKVEPDDKGGMIIPNKDSTIFETLDEDAGRARKVESLLEDAEQPMKKEEVFVEGDTKATDEPVEESPASEEKPEVIVKEEPVSEPAPAPKEIVKEETPKVEKKEVAKVEPKKEKKVDIIDALKQETGTKKADVAKDKPAAKGSVYIQLAAVKSDADAKTKWAQLKSKYSALSALNLKVQKADLAKGTFYRVQAGPTSADNATKLCASIKAAKGDCMIVK